jgi:hypothetical protein
MNIDQVYALQACLQNEEISREIMNIYLKCVKVYLQECHTELAVILGPGGFLVLSLFERPSLLEGLPMTLMEQCPKVRHLIQECVEKTRERHFAHVKMQLLSYLVSVGGVRMYYVWASVVT